MQPIIYSELLKREAVRHFISTKDFSLDGGQGWRLEVARIVDFDPGMAVAPQQTHGNRVVRVTPQLLGHGYTDVSTRVGDCDALICDIPGVCIHVVTADCVPILLYDRSTRAVAAIHAGWRGTALRIVAGTINAMSAAFASQPDDIVAYIGPAIGPCCFEVGQEVVDQIGDRFVRGTSVNGRPMLDIKQANAAQLLAAGVEPCNIEISPVCTVCSSLPSWRREHTTQRIGVGIIAPD